MSKRYSSLLELARLAVGNPQLYIELYSMDKDELVDILESISQSGAPHPRASYEKTLRVLAMATFGNIISIYQTGLMQTINVLRLCDKLDTILAELRKITPFNANAYPTELMEIIGISLDATYIINDAGYYDENGAFQIDAERVRLSLSEELSNKDFVKIFGHQTKRIVSIATKESSDEVLESLIKKTLLDCVEKLLPYCNTDKDIRATTTPTEKFLRENYTFSPELIGEIRDVIENPNDTRLLCEDHFALHKNRMDKLTQIGAPLIILANESRLINKYALPLTLAEYVETQKEITDSERKFVADSYMEMHEYGHIIANGYDKDALEQYKTLSGALLERIKAVAS